MAKTSFSKVPQKGAPAPAARQAAPQGRVSQAPRPAAPTRSAPTQTRPPAPAARQAAPQAQAPARRQAPRQQVQEQEPEQPEEEQPPEEEAQTEVLSEEEQLEQEVNSEAGLAEVPKTSILALNEVPIGQLHGELQGSDFSYPKLKLAQNVGPLFEAGFSPGDIVFNDEIILWQEGCESVELTIISALKQFVEDLPYGSDEMPRIYKTLAEAENDGLVTTWGDNGEKPDVLAQLVCLVMIRLPEGVDPTGFDEIGDGMYALAIWRIAGASYKQLMKTITNALKTRLRGGLHTGTFKLTAQKVKGKVNTFWVPTLSPGEMNSEEFTEILAARAGALTGTGE